MSKHLDQVSALVRRFFSLHFSTGNLKKLAFIVSLGGCLSAGSILLFSLFAISLHDLHGFTYLEISTISSVSAIGMYLLLPVLGYLADSHGPGLLALLSIVLLSPSYYFNAILVSNLDNGNKGQSVYILSITFGLVGLGTSALYFSSLLTCAKIFPNHKGLAISFPVTCYGLSSFIGSQLLKLPYFYHEKYVNLYKTFSFFGSLYLIVGALNFISASLVTIEQDVIFDEESPLLEASEEERGIHEHIERMRVGSIDPSHHRERYKKFLLDKSSWLILISLILNIGSLESYQNNLGSILTILAPKNTDAQDQVSAMAASSTITRLLVGFSSDYLASPHRKYPIGRVWLLVVSLTVSAIAQISVVARKNFFWVSVLNGHSYGALFTLYPTIVASVWGIDIMGSTWGSFMVAPAVGSVIFSLAYGKLVDSTPHPGKHTLIPYFEATAAGMVLSLFIVYGTWRYIWRPRSLDI